MSTAVRRTKSKMLLVIATAVIFMAPATANAETGRRCDRVHAYIVNGPLADEYVNLGRIKWCDKVTGDPNLYQGNWDIQGGDIGTGSYFRGRVHLTYNGNCSCVIVDNMSGFWGDKDGDGNPG